MRTSIVMTFLIALVMSTVAASVLYVHEAHGALDAGLAKAGPPAPAPYATPAPAPVPDPSQNLSGFAAAVMAAAKQSRWLPVFGFGLMLLAWGIRTAATKLGSAWAATTAGGRVIACGAALALAVGTSYAAGQGLSLSLLGTALAAAWTASGAHEDKKDIVAAVKPATPVVAGG